MPTLEMPVGVLPLNRTATSRKRWQGYYNLLSVRAHAVKVHIIILESIGMLIAFLKMVDNRTIGAQIPRWHWCR